MDRDEVLLRARTALEDAGLGAALLGGPGRRPLVELLVLRRRDARAVWRVLDGLPWRWRFGGDGVARALPRRTWSFDGGVLLVAHAALPDPPWPPGATRGLARHVRAATPAGPGVHQVGPATELVRVAVEAAQSGLRYPQLLDDLRELVAQPGAGAWPAEAAAAGVPEAVSRTMAAAQGGTLPPEPRLHRISSRLHSLAGRVLPDRAAWAVTGQPLQSDVVRCRFAGLELLAGPGVFLPRGASEPLVEVAAELLEGAPAEAVLVDVGTGCGAVPLALATRRPGTVVVGTELDPAAAQWARRNAERLGLPLEVHVGSLLDPVPRRLAGTVSVITGNVPCVVASDFSGADDAGRHAYVGGGADGLDLQRAVADQAAQLLRPGGWLVLQLAPAQWAAFQPELEQRGYVVEVTRSNGAVQIRAARWSSEPGPTGEIDTPDE